MRSSFRFSGDGCKKMENFLTRVRKGDGKLFGPVSLRSVEPKGNPCQRLLRREFRSSTTFEIQLFPETFFRFFAFGGNLRTREREKGGAMKKIRRDPKNFLFPSFSTGCWKFLLCSSCNKETFFLSFLLLCGFLQVSFCSFHLLKSDDEYYCLASFFYKLDGSLRNFITNQTKVTRKRYREKRQRAIKPWKALGLSFLFIPRAAVESFTSAINKSSWTDAASIRDITRRKRRRVSQRTNEPIKRRLRNNNLKRKEERKGPFLLKSSRRLLVWPSTCILYFSPFSLYWMQKMKKLKSRRS